MTEVITKNLDDIQGRISLLCSSVEYFNDYGTCVSMQNTDENTVTELIKELLGLLKKSNEIMDVVCDIICDSFGK